MQGGSRVENKKYKDREAVGLSGQNPTRTPFFLTIIITNHPVLKLAPTNNWRY